MKTKTKSSKSLPRDYYIVEEIIDRMWDPVKKIHLYLVKWQDYSHNDNTWEPKLNLENVIEMVQEFDDNYENR